MRARQLELKYCLHVHEYSNLSSAYVLKNFRVLLVEIVWLFSFDRKKDEEVSELEASSINGHEDEPLIFMLLLNCFVIVLVVGRFFSFSSWLHAMVILQNVYVSVQSKKLGLRVILLLV